MGYYIIEGVIALVLIVVAWFVAIAYRKNIAEAKIGTAEEQAKEIINEAQKTAEAKKREAMLEAKEDALKTRNELEKEVKDRRGELSRMEKRILAREENIDRKAEAVEKKENSLAQKENAIEKQKAKIDELQAKKLQELERISGLSKTEAKEILIAKLRDDLTHETAVAIREFENKLEDEKDRISRRILSTAIGKASAEYVVDATVSVVNLPNDEMKGRIIGREGRNIRAIEALTGVDIIIDDTPEAVVLSSFDGVKREIARLAIEKLITDGRIHPGKIEEVVNKARKEIEKEIVDAGEGALIELGIPGMHPEIIRTLGRLKYRTSYGQNVLTHSIEVAKLAANLAAEIGADTELAKRAGLLHDVGKVLESDIEASHALIGGEFLKKFGEKQDVLNAVMAHHNEVEFETVEAIIVQAADAVSASRPGARRETLTAYLKRLESLEEIANSFSGVESSFAIQAGRELRIIVNPEAMSDDEATKMARDVAKKIEESMQYPGQIKVTIVRETRAVDYAK